MRFEIGSRLGPYEITGRIGSGGMGEVYRARDTRLGREVAIKVLPDDVLRDPARVARFKREACSASALNHRNIVTVHDFTTSQDEAWLVMELIRGQSLREIVSNGALPLKKVVTIGIGIADGLAAAHDAGIVHRDLKPENVMVTNDGTAKILDFGLVKQAAPAADPDSPTDMHVSQSGVVMGTAAYMSPEQARGGDVGFRTDQFALGMILHELATGKHPFARPSGIETVAAIINDDPRPLDDRYPEAFREIVERCLAKNPSERYGSTTDLAHDLRRVASQPARAPARRPARAWVSIAALGVITLLAAAGVLLWLRRPAVSNDPFELAVATPQFAEVFRDELSNPVSLSPNGRYLIVYGKTADKIPALWVHDLRSGTRKEIATNTFTAGWSPDSKSIAYFADGKLKTISIAGGPPRVICDARPEGYPSWRGDNIVFTQFTVKDYGAYRVSAGGGEPRLIAGADPRRRGSLPFWPELLPDGKHFIFLMLLQEGMAKGVIEHELYVGSLDGKPPKRVPGAIDSRALYANGHLLFVRDGTLLAQPFDPDRAQFTGEPEPITDDIHYFRSTGLAAFTASDTGVIAWRKAEQPSRLVWFDRAGTELEMLGTNVFHRDGRFSPDGHRFAVSIVDPKQGVSDIWSFDLDRGSSQRLTFRLLDEIAPVWAHDGQSIYYRGDGNGPPDIFLLRPGADVGEIFFAGPAVEEPHDVSPDGKWMLYVERLQTTIEDVYVLSLTGQRTARPLIATPFRETSPRFSPDGRWVAYESDVSGRPEVYVRAFEGGGATMRVSRDGGSLPRWQRDGKELLFLAPGGKIMSAAVHNGAVTSTPRVLFQVSDAINFEPAPDGRLLLQLQQGSSEPPTQILVNWPQRLQSQ